MAEFADHVAFVTGGSGGIGRSVARELAGRGARVVIVGTSQERGEAAARDLGDQVDFHRLDVTDEPAWDATARWLADQYGRLDVLVTCAGIVRGTSILEISAAEMRDVLNVNVVGTHLAIRALAPLMSDSGGGSIVTMASMNGIQPAAGVGSYAASKWAVRGLTRSAAFELAPLGIRVNCVCPGSIVTDFTGNAGIGGVDWEAYSATIPMRRRGTVDEVARAIAYLAGSESDYITGTDLLIDGGVLAGRAVPQRRND